MLFTKTIGRGPRSCQKSDENTLFWVKNYKCIFILKDWKKFSRGHVLYPLYPTLPPFDGLKKLLLYSLCSVTC